MTEILIGLPFAFFIAYLTIRDVGKLAHSPVRLPEPDQNLHAATIERLPKPQPNGYIRPKLEITNLEEFNLCTFSKNSDSI